MNDPSAFILANFHNSPLSTEETSDSDSAWFFLICHAKLRTKINGVRVNKKSKNNDFRVLPLLAQIVHIPYEISYVDTHIFHEYLCFSDSVPNIPKKKPMSFEYFNMNYKGI